MSARSGAHGWLLHRGLVAVVVVAGACAAPAGEPALAPRRAAPPMPSPAPPSSPAEVIAAIAREIAQLKPGCPQLVELDPDKHVEPSLARLQYGYHTHRSTRRGGWTSGVPNPDPDGVWLYVDIHDPSSMSQIHTQPAVPMLDVGGKRLMMLLLEGEGVPSCAGKIWAILGRYGQGPRVGP
jgi:hypothetical protein